MEKTTDLGSRRYGATPAEWELFADRELGLGLIKDLLPIVSNPNAPISEKSHLGTLGKTPSVYNKQREVVGLTQWAKREATSADIRRWCLEPDYGLGIQTRHARAMDVDVEDSIVAAAIYHEVSVFLGYEPPARGRPNSAKFLVPFILPGEFQKVVINLSDRGRIEVLMNGQQFVAAGTHPTGVRYTWNTAFPRLRTLSAAQFEGLKDMLVAKFANNASGAVEQFRERGAKLAKIMDTDPVANFLREQGIIYREESDGTLIVRCPWHTEHTADGNKHGDEAAYFVQHTKGFENGGFKCLHAHCADRKLEDFLLEIGFLTEEEIDLDDVMTSVATQIKQVKSSVLFLPNDYLFAPAAARRIFKYLGSQRELFLRGYLIVEIGEKRQLEIVTAEGFRSRLNAGKRNTRAFGKMIKTGDLVHIPKICSLDTAKMLLATRETRLLPPIALVTQQPILALHEGALLPTAPGYNDFAHGIYVLSELAIEPVRLPQAVASLRALLQDFKFAGPGDEARALVSLVAPALRMGRLVDADALALAVEADESQTGKGYLLKLLRGIYGEQPFTINLKTGGVGSVDEAIHEALLSGRPFIEFDNVRGKLDSQVLESVLTAGADPIQVRVPHRASSAVSAQCTSFQLTSNGIDSTVDLANRLLVVRLRKQPAGYRFKTYNEGAPLAHVENRRGHYLGCVHALVQAWFAAGRPVQHCDHSFWQWAGTLNWIATHLFETCSIMTGHDVAISRVAKPQLTWLRHLALAVLKAGRGGEELRASELFEWSIGNELSIPGFNPDRQDVSMGPRAIGSIMSRCFGPAKSEVIIEDVRVLRTEIIERTDQRKDEVVKYYTFFAHSDGL